MRREHLAIVASLVLLVAVICPVSATIIPGMALTASPASVAPGDVLTYTITASNSGTEISNPRIEFAYDANLDYVSASPVSNQELQGFTVTNPAFWFSTDTPPRIVQVNPLGGTYAIIVTTRVKASAPCGSSVTSTATMIDAGDDNPPSQASAGATTQVTCPVQAPEFPTPAVPAAMLGLLVLTVLAIRSKVN
ncbi:MAG TPA: hypothetical protein VEI51_00835 [Methanomicrobiales archaeon]|nr:hypothetical protein [Methanomicrobiales archaeon]